MSESTAPVIRRLEEIHREGMPLGRHVEHDPASRAYAIDDALPKELSAKPVLWRRYSPILKQRIGSCTGEAAAGWLGCAPHSASAMAAAQFTQPLAEALYERATHLDRIPGAYPPDDTGSSGLAVAKAMRERGLISAYRHAFSTASMLRALALGPVLVGSVWYESMDNPDAEGTIEIGGGAIRGGHEYLIRGVDPDAAGGPIDSTAWLIGDNSWGVGFGHRGSFRYRVSGWDKLREEQGDVTIPIAA